MHKTASTVLPKPAAFLKLPWYLMKAKRTTED